MSLIGKNSISSRGPHSIPDRGPRSLAKVGPNSLSKVGPNSCLLTRKSIYSVGLGSKYCKR